MVSKFTTLSVTEMILPNEQKDEIEDFHEHPKTISYFNKMSRVSKKTYFLLALGTIAIIGIISSSSYATILSLLLKWELKGKVHDLTFRFLFCIIIHSLFCPLVILLSSSTISK